MSEDSRSNEAHEQKDAYEARLQERLKILKQKLAEGKVKFAQGLRVIDSLKKVQYLPDGNADLNTVDGLVRSLALGIGEMHNREELKRTASLVDIQSTYFTFVEKNFGELHRIMVERDLTPHDVGLGISKSTESTAEIIAALPEFISTIEEFWNSIGDVAIAHVEDMHESLKGVYGGDLFPAATENIVSKCGLYTDTIVLPDPYLRTKHIFALSADDRKAYYAVKHAMNLLQYKDLACADITPPIVVVLPDVSVLDEKEREYFYNLGREDAVEHASRIFGRTFESFDEVLDFCGKLDTIESLTAEIKDNKRVLFDTDWKGTIPEQLARVVKDPNYAGLLQTTNPGIIMASQSVGRMGTSNELLIKARRLNGTPILDAPTSWQYFVWKLEYDARHSETINGLKNLHVVRAIQNLANNDMRWLGNIPIKALLEVRKSGSLGEVRGILGKGIDELAVANPNNFYRTSDRVFDNINEAFLVHQKNIDKLIAKKWKFAGSDLGSWLVVGSLAVTAAATQVPVWALAALAADQLLSAPKLRQIPKTIKDLATETREIKRSPVGMLFGLSKKYE